MIDYRVEFEGLVRRQLEDPALNPQEREVLEASLAVHNAEPFGPVAPDSPSEPDFSFLDRYPQDAKLVAMRILRELGVLDRLGATQPAVYAALVVRLMAYEGPRATLSPDTSRPLDRPCPECGKIHPGRVVIIDDNPLSWAAYLEEHPKTAKLIEESRSTEIHP